MRTAFIDQLLKERENNDRIFLIVGDLGYNVVNTFAERFPESYLNAGIAEQNMMGVAAGLANEGYIVYVYSIGNFPTLRCMEQIRNDVAYNNLNVRIVSVGAGFAYGSLGASHHTTEDIAMLSSLPNMTVCSPGDPMEAQRVTALSVSHEGPMYIRLGKAGEKDVHEQNKQLEFNIGDIVPVHDTDSQVAVLATGSILYKVCSDNIQRNMNYSVYSVPTVKPLNTTDLIRIATKHSSLVVMEEHQLNGGLGTIISAMLSDSYSSNEIVRFPKIIRIGVKDRFIYTVGSQQSIRASEGLGLPDIIKD